MQPSASALASGSCVGDFGWSATVAASGQSTLAGVLAGFVFGGVVVVLSVRVASRTKEAASALKLLFCAFFGLTVAAYLLADVTGDKNCLRATSEETLSGGIFGTFAVIMLVSLTWLVVAYDRHANGVLRSLRHLIYVASAFVMLLLCTSSSATSSRKSPHGPPPIVAILIYLAGGLLYLIALPVSLRFAALLMARITRITASANSEFVPEGSGIDQAKRSPVDLCVWAALGYVAFAAITDAFVLSLSDSVWNRPRVPAAYAVAWSSLLLPLTVLILALRALAPDQAASHDALQEFTHTPSD